jgi:hypothetical protein
MLQAIKLRQHSADKITNCPSPAPSAALWQGKHIEFEEILALLQRFEQEAEQRTLVSL